MKSLLSKALLTFLLLGGVSGFLFFNAQSNTIGGGYHSNAVETLTETATDYTLGGWPIFALLSLLISAFRAKRKLWGFLGKNLLKAIVFFVMYGLNESWGNIPGDFLENLFPDGWMSFGLFTSVFSWIFSFLLTGRRKSSPAPAPAEAE